MAKRTNIQKKVCKSEIGGLDTKKVVMPVNLIAFLLLWFVDKRGLSSDPSTGSNFCGQQQKTKQNIKNSVFEPLASFYEKVRNYMK